MNSSTRRLMCQLYVTMLQHPIWILKLHCYKTLFSAVIIYHSWQNVFNIYSLISEFAIFWYVNLLLRFCTCRYVYMYIAHFNIFCNFHAVRFNALIFYLFLVSCCIQNKNWLIFTLASNVKKLFTFCSLIFWGLEKMHCQWKVANQCLCLLFIK
jgi:hypothetical protein